MRFEEGSLYNKTRLYAVSSLLEHDVVSIGIIDISYEPSAAIFRV
jgi:hypothetical protein